ncbi:COG1361 family protein [Halorussus salinisoli]|uniref:hypothetical protein n=1 Tax=Halorussus salinisoli TaxID=2558242 RepID=UPI0010C201A2|nr:hypothetical protein [Halorussus salinisoli]
MDVSHAIAVVLLCITTLVAPGTAITANDSCSTVDSAKVCVKGFSVTKNTLLTGEQAKLLVTVENSGSEPATVLVTLNTAGPNNTTGVFPIGEHTLLPGENKTITQTLNGSSPGTHGFRVLVTEADTDKRFDTSEIATIEVRTDPPTRLGGPIDRTEVALVALVLSIAGIVGLGYHQFTN